MVVEVAFVVVVGVGVVVGGEGSNLHSTGKRGYKRIKNLDVLSGGGCGCCVDRY